MKAKVKMMIFCQISPLNCALLARKQILQVLIFANWKICFKLNLVGPETRPAGKILISMLEKIDFTKLSEDETEIILSQVEPLLGFYEKGFKYPENFKLNFFLRDCD